MYCVKNEPLCNTKVSWPIWWMHYSCINTCALIYHNYMTHQMCPVCIYTICTYSNRPKTQKGFLTFEDLMRHSFFCTLRLQLGNVNIYLVWWHQRLVNSMCIWLAVITAFITHDYNVINTMITSVWPPESWLFLLLIWMNVISECADIDSFSPYEIEVYHMIDLNRLA